MGHATCIVDLPNIELIATGSYRKRIELWVLRTKNTSNNAVEEIMGSSSTVKDKKSKSKSKQKDKKNVEVQKNQ
jgi:hypothetical protein